MGYWGGGAGAGGLSSEPGLYSPGLLLAQPLLGHMEGAQSWQGASCPVSPQCDPEGRMRQCGLSQGAAPPSEQDLCWGLQAVKDTPEETGLTEFLPCALSPHRAVSAQHACGAFLEGSSV